MTNESENSAEKTPVAHASTLSKLFDIRSIIAALLGIYGVFLLIAGIAPGFADAGAKQYQHTPDRADLAVGSVGNLWVGAALLLVAVAFGAWAVLGSRDAGS